MYSFFIGIDVSKDHFDAAYVLFGKVFYLGRFKNSQEGFISLLCELKQVANYKLDKWFFCFENTGVYSETLFFWLHENGIAFKAENPIQIHRSLGLKRGKNDKADAQAIALYCFEKRDSLQATKPAKPIVYKLKKLVLRRDFLVKQRTAVLTSFKMQRQTLDEDLMNIFEEQTQELVLTFNKQIKEIERKIKQVKSQDIYLNKNDELVRSVVGIGHVISTFMLAYTENFERITEPKKLASFIGIAPFENSSGKFVGKTKISYLANKKIKSLLSNAAYSAINYDPQIAKYYERKIKEGKPQSAVINAVKNKLVQRIYAVVKRQTPYVKLN